MCNDATPMNTLDASQLKANEKNIVLHAPAALLLCGEYFVTEAGGQGLCLAVEPRAVCRLLCHDTMRGSGSTVRLITRFAGEENIFENASENKLYRHCETCSALYMALYEKRSDFFDGLSVSIDTQAFYNTSHEGSGLSRKRGLGSSETAAVLMCAALALLEGREPLSKPHVLAAHAAHAHYAWQGGRGSGYGVWTSVFGGLGLYTNRALHESTTPFLHNSWREVMWGVHSFLYWCFENYDNAQSSQAAIQRYTAWKEENAYEALDFSMRYQRFFDNLAACILGNETAQRCAEGIVQALDEARALSEWIGDAIGVTSRISDRMDIVHAMRTYKAVGAGSECAVGLSYVHECQTVPTSARSRLDVSTGIRYAT